MLQMKQKTKFLNIGPCTFKYVFNNIHVCEWDCSENYSLNIKINMKESLCDLG